MTKQIYFWLILLFSTNLFAQSNSKLDTNLTSGKQILKDARKAIGTEEINLQSFSLKMKIVSGKTLEELMVEIKVLLPDKFEEILSKTQPYQSTYTSFWNGNKYKSIADSMMMGQRYVSDVTNLASNSESTEKLENKMGKDKAEQMKRLRLRKKDPKERFYIDNIWQVFFPLTLIQPFDQNLEYNYIGKAQSENRTANIVDVISKDGKKYRLFFDSETNNLLMMFESHEGQTISGVDGTYESRRYFSNRKTINSILIPTTIKIEYKFIPKIGREPKISYETIDILEFKLNPEFKKDMFDIK